MDQQKIGTFLKQLRQERQLTQENLAEIMCVTNRSVSRWENGVNLPDLLPSSSLPIFTAWSCVNC